MNKKRIQRMSREFGISKSAAAFLIAGILAIAAYYELSPQASDLTRWHSVSTEPAEGGAIVPPVVNRPQPAQGAGKPAVAGGPAIGNAMDVAREKQRAEARQFQTDTAWFQKAHAHAALYGEDAPLPSQF